MGVLFEGGVYSRQYSIRDIKNLFVQENFQTSCNCVIGIAIPQCHCNQGEIKIGHDKNSGKSSLLWRSPREMQRKQLAVGTGKLPTMGYRSTP